MTGSILERAKSKVVLGTFVFEFATPAIGRIAAHAGADFVVFDLEHSGVSLETVKAAIAPTRSTAAAPLVRVADHSRHQISGALDCGATGVIVPMVETEAQARQVVSFALYQPDGTRGAAFGMAHHDFAEVHPVTAMRQANASTSVVVQIETAQGLDNVEGIAAVDGIGGLWMGQFDLTISMGIPGEFDHPRFLEASKRVAEAGRTNGIPVGLMATSVKQAYQFIDLGYRIVAFDSDISIYRSRLSEGLAAIRSHSGDPIDD